MQVRAGPTSWLPPFLLGTIFAAAVAWVMWPKEPAAATPDPTRSRVMRELGALDLGGGDRVRALAIPNPDGFSSTVCVIYTSEVETIMQCPAADAIDVGE